MGDKINTSQVQIIHYNIDTQEINSDISVSYSEAENYKFHYNEIEDKYEIENTNEVVAYKYDSGKPGKNVLILGAVHGNEICGPDVSFALMKQIESGKLELQGGSLTFIPICNPKAHMEGKRSIYEGGNVNRQFIPDIPGAVSIEGNGELYDLNLAKIITKEIDKCNVLVDIHSYPTEGEPSTFCDVEYNKEFVYMAQITTLGVVLCGWCDMYGGTKEDGTTCGYACRHGKIAITLECGSQIGENKEETIDRGLQSTLNIISKQGLIDETHFKQPENHKQQWVDMLEMSKRMESGQFAKKKDGTERIVHCAPIKKGEIIVCHDSGEYIVSCDNSLIIMPDTDNPSRRNVLDVKYFYTGINEKQRQEELIKQGFYDMSVSNVPQELSEKYKLVHVQGYEDKEYINYIKMYDDVKEFYEHTKNQEKILFPMTQQYVGGILSNMLLEDLETLTNNLSEAAKQQSKIAEEIKEAHSTVNTSNANDYNKAKKLLKDIQNTDDEEEKKVCVSLQKMISRVDKLKDKGYYEVKLDTELAVVAPEEVDDKEKFIADTASLFKKSIKSFTIYMKNTVEYDSKESGVDYVKLRDFIKAKQKLLIDKQDKINEEEKNQKLMYGVILEIIDPAYEEQKKILDDVETELNKGSKQNSNEESTMTRSSSNVSYVPKNSDTFNVDSKKEEMEEKKVVKKQQASYIPGFNGTSLNGGLSMKNSIGKKESNSEQKRL